MKLKDNFVFNLIFITIMIFGIEMIFRGLSDFEILSYSSLRILLSSFILTFIIVLLSNLFKKRWVKNTINIIYVFLYALYSILQVGFINYLGVYISFHTSSQFGAVTDYIKDYLESFKFNYFYLFIPFILTIVVYIIVSKTTKYYKFEFNKKKLIFIPIIIISCALYYGTIIIPFMQNKFQIKSNRKLFNDPDVPTVAVNQFGTMVFGILDFKSFVFPVPEEAEEFVIDNSSNVPAESADASLKREVLPYLNDLADNDTDNKYKDLNKYFASRYVTDKNEYTGMFEGKNVIVLLLESVNDAFINEEYFPNYYKMYSNGWHWENNYSPRNSCATGNNEFSAMTGLYSIYNTCTSNVYKNNTYFESIFGLFNDKGYRTTSFHDFVEWYYKRSVIHPNMGSGKFYGANDLNIKTAGYYGEWPSDVEFFEKAFDIVLNDTSEKPFMTWLTTVTSHQPYNNSSTYGNKYLDYFKSEGYSTSVSRYLSKLKVVDEALGVMLNRLEEKGILDDTVIVMLADHYPYGLNNSYVSELVDYDLKEYEIERTPFVIYNSTMTPQTRKEYTFYVNLVPTLANLMNLDYDPRLYMGSDVLSSSYVSKVVFADGSWKNESVYYNASTSKLKYYDENASLTPEQIQRINSEVNSMISMSSKAIKNNYFNYLGEKRTEYLNSITPTTEEKTEEVASTEQVEEVTN